MILLPTVLVLGAGASEPYGFPLSRELVGQTVVELKNPESVTHRTLLECGFSSSEQDAFAGHLAGSGRLSIDAFLEGRPECRAIGTAAIAAALVPRETWFDLHGADILGAHDWYQYFWNALGNRVEEIRENKVSVISYNYDRSLEQYLMTAAMDSWNLTLGEAAEIIASIEVVHLHGQLGGLPGLAQSGAFMRPYKGDVDPWTILSSASAIKIVHDAIDDDPQFARAKEIIRSATVICFLGFGFSLPNVRRLFSFEGTQPPRVVVGSAKGIARGERYSIQEMFSHDRITLLDQRWDCLRALREYPALNWHEYVARTEDRWGTNMHVRLDK